MRHEPPRPDRSCAGAPRHRFFALANADLAREILANLIDNALHYAGPGLVELNASWGDIGKPIVCVRDNGPGVAPSERERVMERF